MSRMPAADLRRSLTNYVKRVEEMRDDAYADAQSGDEYIQRAGKHMWSGYALALDALYHTTGGEYGTPYHKQQSPYRCATVSGSREGADR